MIVKKKKKKKGWNIYPCVTLCKIPLKTCRFSSISGMLTRGHQTHTQCHNSTVTLCVQLQIIGLFWLIWKEGFNKNNKKEREEREREREHDGGRDREKVQYNYPGTFQSWYMKPAHCAAADNMTASKTNVQMHRCEYMHACTRAYIWARLHHHYTKYESPLHYIDLFSIKNICYL